MRNGDEAYEEEEEEEGQAHVELTYPLFIRLLEWAREDAKDDLQVHRLVECAIDMLQEDDECVLDMDDYDELMAAARKGSSPRVRNMYKRGAISDRAKQKRYG